MIPVKPIKLNQITTLDSDCLRTTEYLVEDDSGVIAVIIPYSVYAQYFKGLNGTNENRQE